MAGCILPERSVGIFALESLRETVFGVLAQVSLPTEKTELDHSVLKQLFEAEQQHAAGLHGFRQIEFVGGRLAFRAAAQALSVDAPLLPSPQGIPLAPPGLTVSISHKRSQAVALVAHLQSGTVGIDLEDDPRPRLAIAGRVLRAEEYQQFEALPEPQRWPFLQRVFALKEATYKAIFPHLQRFVAFDEASVLFDAAGSLRIVLHLKTPAPKPLRLEAFLETVPDGVMAFVRARAVTAPKTVEAG